MRSIYNLLSMKINYKDKQSNTSQDKPSLGIFKAKFEVNMHGNLMIPTDHNLISSYII